MGIKPLNWHWWSYCQEQYYFLAEYAIPVWDPHYKIHIQNIEKIQKSAAHYVCNNYVMESGNTAMNLKSLGRKPLEERRLDNK